MMKGKHFILTAALSIVLILQSEAQVNVSMVTDPAAFEGKEGSFYYLPGTYLELEVCFDLVEKIRGPYADYAYKFLGLDSVITINERFYELKGIRCDTRTGPDPGQLYFVEFLQKQSKDPLELHMVFSEEGFLTEAAMGMDMTSVPVTVQPENGPGVMPCNKVDREGLFRYYATSNQVLKIDTIIKMVTIDTSTFKDISYKRSMIYKTMEERAGEAAELISSIREDRLKLLTGYQEVGYSQGTMEYMDARLLGMEDAYLSLFKGYVSREGYKVRLVYFPSSEKVGQADEICRFSSTAGISGSHDPQGEPVLIRIEPVGASGAVPSQVSGSPSAAGQGFVFRTPGLCRVSIQWKENEMLNKEIPIHQLGILSHYPATSRFHVQMHPAGGSVRQVSVR